VGLYDTPGTVAIIGDYTGTGIFQIDTYTLNSQYMQSMSKKLLALNAGPATFFFNSSGYFFYDGTSCNWLTFCDFECEVYNYDSRFLDFVGVWTITSKRGIDSIN